ncbi:hypothetical protein J4N45_14135 [Vibrio sp. SCSIO 43140]|uniref:hypothetical protein n=1 Tax=Vibrio sp. SCSIO 43140 TaxID=2819100 RepID=UPI0020757108|nr:hypothetical protein [Vibrio sp. SCSIO 43140]USD59645.1 hypothetical protein J4N45_14135 [Vibrio sp. SCSIO 43140]
MVNDKKTVFANLSGQLFATSSRVFAAIDGLGLSVEDLCNGNMSTGQQFITESTGTFKGEVTGEIVCTEFYQKQENGYSANIHGILNVDGHAPVSIKMLGLIDADGTSHYQIALRQHDSLALSLNHLHLFAQGKTDFAKGSSQLEIIRCDSNPFGNGRSLYLGGNAFFDPDAPLVNYKDFPFTLESLKDATDTTLIYAGQGNLNGIEAFGANIQAVFGGQHEIPEEGLRLNGYFSGPVAGSINGVITGRNFLRVMPDGSMSMNSKIIVRTTLGETVLLEALGASFIETGTAWFETSRTVSNSEKYAHLTKLYNVGVGSTDITTQQIIYNHYGFNNNPFK